MRKYLMETYLTIGCSIWFLTVGLLLAFPGVRGVAAIFIFVGIVFVLLAGHEKVQREVRNTRSNEEKGADGWLPYE